jgi:hypothetical protein
MRGALRLTCLSILVPVAACGDSDAPEPAPDGGSGELPGCEPTPARCDAIGDARPARLSEHSVAYDPQRLELVVFGGTHTVPMECNFPAAEFVDETWIYDDVCDGWIEVEGAAPSPSGRHMSAWGDGKVWVFGGRYRAGETGAYDLYADLYRFDVAERRWRSADVEGDRPEARVNGGLVWDGSRERLWLIGGNTSTSGAAYVPVADVWSFDPAAGRWEKHQVEGRLPPPRLLHAAFYDRVRDTIVMYGGADERAFQNDVVYFGDLWSLELASMRWTLLDDGAGEAPEGRFWPGMVHDVGRDRYLLFAGHQATGLGNRNDTWSFDPEAGRWELLLEGDGLGSPPNGFCDFPPDFSLVDRDTPERRSAHGLAWSEACGHALVFGGKTDCGAIDDVWTFDGDAWEERQEATEGEVCARWRDEPDTCGDMCF